jgi:hypothetical protein
MIRQWRHLKMAKRSGRGHDPGGISKTPPGGFAILCRACPEPAINLPSDWRSAPAERAWLYASILNQHANFRLKNRLRGSSQQDPPLGPGYAYFVEGQAYADHLRNYVDQKEVCSPSRFLSFVVCTDCVFVRLVSVPGSPPFGRQIPRILRVYVQPVLALSVVLATRYSAQMVQGTFRRGNGKAIYVRILISFLSTICI